MWRRNWQVFALAFLGFVGALAYGQVSGPTTLTPKLHVLGALTVDGGCTGCGSSPSPNLHLTGTLQVDGATTLGDVTINGTCTGCGGGGGGSSGARVCEADVSGVLTDCTLADNGVVQTLPSGWTVDNTNFLSNGTTRLNTNLSCTDSDGNPATNYTGVATLNGDFSTLQAQTSFFDITCLSGKVSVFLTNAAPQSDGNWLTWEVALTPIS